jgi:ParB-like chromosome segregation protein Spo0J
MSEETKTAPPAAIPEYEIHEMANLFPMMTGPAWKDFVNAIKTNGVTDEIVLTPDGKTIIDGRNRYKACQELGIKPLTRKFGSRPTDGTSIAGFVIRANLQRRQLDDSQRAMVGAKLSKLGRGQKSKDGKELTQEDITALLNVSGASLSRAKRTTDKATKAIRVMVEEKEISVSVGAALAGLSNEEQNKLAMEGAKACRQRAMEIMQPAKSGNKDAQKTASDKAAKREEKAKQQQAEKERKQKLKDNKAEADKLLVNITDLAGGGKHLEAIDLCRKGLELSPSHAKILKLKEKSQAAMEKAAATQKKLDEAKAKEAAKKAQQEFGASAPPVTEHQAAETASKLSPKADLIIRGAAVSVLQNLVKEEYKDGKPVNGCDVVDRCIRAIKNIPAEG